MKIWKRDLLSKWIRRLSLDRILELVNQLQHDLQQLSQLMTDMLNYFNSLQLHIVKTHQCLMLCIPNNLQPISMVSITTVNRNKTFISPCLFINHQFKLFIHWILLNLNRLSSQSFKVPLHLKTISKSSTSKFKLILGIWVLELISLSRTPPLPQRESIL